MTVEIRPARLEEMEEFRRVASIALAMPVESFIGVQPEFTLCAFENGKLTTTYGAWPFTMRFNGDGIPVAGVTSVSTFPIYRRRGYLRQITKMHFQFLHEQGERSIAILLASLAAIYQRYGYAVVSTRHSYDVEPRYLTFALDQPVNGTLRELGDDEFGLLVDLYRRFREVRTGYIHRGQAMWNFGVLAPPPADSQLMKVVYEESGKPQGYVIYEMTLPGKSMAIPKQRVTIRDLAWLTAPAYRAIWSHFSAMDIVINIVWERVPADDPLPHLLLEPRMLNITAKDGIMGRIVDIERAFSKMRFNDEGALTFEVIDELCSWNHSKWRLETSPAGNSIHRSAEDTQLVMPVSTLAMLVFGQISATEAAKMGRLDVKDENSPPLWDRVMRTKYRPFCPEYF
jgi:predicted acetyltransferase